MKALNSIIGALVVVSATAFSAPSQAATAYRVAINHASAACMGSSQHDRNVLQAEAMTLYNASGDTPADVKCGGVATPYNNGGDVELYETAITNDTGESVDVNCSLADGVQDGTFTVATMYPKTITIGAGNVGYIDWTTDDTGGPNFVFPSLVCQLPMNVGISYTAVVYQVDVGQ